MTYLLKKHASAILITMMAAICLPSTAQAACQPVHCVNTSQSSTRVSMESGVRVYRGTVYPQDYNSQIQDNAQRDRAAAAQALRAKRTAERKARTAEAKRAQAEKALAAEKSNKRSTSRSAQRGYGSRYISPRRAYSFKPKGYNTARKSGVTYTRRIR